MLRVIIGSWEAVKNAQRQRNHCLRKKAFHVLVNNAQELHIQINQANIHYSHHLIRKHIELWSSTVKVKVVFKIAI